MKSKKSQINKPSAKKSLQSLPSDVSHALGLERFGQRITERIVWNVRNEEAKSALTFDDGPHPESTPQILEILEEFRVLATFFLVGKHIASNKTCPTCKQSMNVDRTQQLKNEYESISEDIEKNSIENMPTKKAMVADKIKILEELRPSGIKEKLEWIDDEISRKEIARTTEENRIASLQNDLQGADIDEVTKKRNRYNSLLIQKGRSMFHHQSNAQRPESQTCENGCGPSYWPLPMSSIG